MKNLLIHDRSGAGAYDDLGVFRKGLKDGASIFQPEMHIIRVSGLFRWHGLPPAAENRYCANMPKR